MKRLASLALTVRTPGEWAAWARDVARLLGDQLARALGEPGPRDE